MSLTWPWPPSCSRSSTRASSSATAPTGPAHGPPRRPATSPPAKINPASSASPDASRSTASDPDPQAKRKAIGTRPAWWTCGEGFDFLGFHIKWMRKRGTDKWFVYTFIADKPVRE